MIRITIAGRIGSDAELRTLESGDHAISFNVCHSEKYTDRNGTKQEIAHWVRCTRWVKKDGSTAIAQYLKKGQTVLVEGIPSARAWVKDGSTEAASSLECRVTSIELLGSAPTQTNAQPAAQHPQAPANNTVHDWGAPVADDLPF